MDIFSIAAKITLDTEQFTKGISDASGKVKDFSAKIGSGLKTAAKIGTTAIVGLSAAAAAAGTAMFKMADKTSKAGDVIDKNSQKVGLSYSAYQKWDYVMKLAGSEMSSCTVGLKTLTNTFDDAKNGSAKATEKFQRLGLSVKDLEGLSREDVFGKVIEALQGVSDETEKAALANDLFGKSGQDLIPLLNMTSEEVHKAMQEAEDYGMVMSDEAVKSSAAFQDSLTKLQSSFTGLVNNLTSSLLPTFTSVMDGISDLVAGKEGATEKISAGIQTLLNDISTFLSDHLADIVNFLVAQTPIIVDAGFQLFTSLLDSMPSIIDNLCAVIPNLIDGLIGSRESGKGIAGNIDKIIDGGLNLLSHLVDDIPGIIKALGTGLGNLVGAIATKIADPEFLAKLVQTAISLGIAIVQGIVQGILSFAGAIKDAIDSALNYDPWEAKKQEAALDLELVKSGGMTAKEFQRKWQGVGYDGEYITDMLYDNTFDAAKDREEMFAGNMTKEEYNYRHDRMAKYGKSTAADDAYKYYYATWAARNGIAAGPTPDTDSTAATGNPQQGDTYINPATGKLMAWADLGNGHGTYITINAPNATAEDIASEIAAYLATQGGY